LIRKKGRSENLIPAFPNPGEMPPLTCTENYGNFGNYLSFHSFATLMEAIDLKIKILKGAADLFLKYGIRSVSMDNIAHQLGVSKKTLYLSFQDKDEIVRSFTEMHIQGHLEDYDAVAASSGNSVEELANLSACMRKNLRNMNPSVLYDLQKYHHDSWNVWLEYKEKHIRNSIVRVLNRGKEEGFFRQEANTDILATARLELIQLAFDPAVFPKEKYELTEVQMELFEHFVYGLFTDKGKKLYEKYKLKTINQEQHSLS
jgi:TetR/AcrR family transcriptional regulator, cholesterol catabolism regulator